LHNVLLTYIKRIVCTLYNFNYVYALHKAFFRQVKEKPMICDLEP
jgi:hypothetical protein